MSDATILDPSVEKMTTAFRRMLRTLELRPQKAQGTATTRVRVTDGMTCQVSEGEWEIAVDLPDRWGGNNAGPNPGVLGRASLGSCLAIAYRRWASEHGIPIRSLEIQIEADYDARGELGLADVSPAYSEVRYTVSVESDAPEEEIRRVFDLAETRCPYLVVWREPMTMRRELRINEPTE